GLPLFEYLGGKKGDKHLKTDITISLEKKEKMVNDTVKAIEDGFSTIKIKLGRSKEEDIDRIAALADVIPNNVVVRLDANQGWGAKDAVEIIEFAVKKGLNIDLVEQPVMFYDLKGMEFVTKNTEIKILADESVFNVHDAEKIIENGAADMINIKLMKCGGIYEGRKIFDLCSANNVECMLGSMMEGAVSIASAAHFAAATGITRLDLDAPVLCKSIPQKMGTTFDSENIYINGGKNGLGIE
ncbi:MAG: dipeptide epimerase, partial [Clostridia bacterium]|nr:dipeptide epimerase [Clostridia bacterium]